VSKFQELSILQLLLDEKYVFFATLSWKTPKDLDSEFVFLKSVLSYFYQILERFLKCIQLNPDDNRVQGPNEFAKITSKLNST
jgi:hypothetical protein